MRKKIWFLSGIIIVLAAAIFAFPAEPPKPSASSVSELALLLSVEPTAKTISVDPVEWLQGEAATQAALKANPECTRRNIEDCAATLANNFYISNAEKQSITYIVPSGAVIKVLAGGSAEFQPGPSDLSALAARLQNISPATRLVRLTRTGNRVSELEEVYMP